MELNDKQWREFFLLERSFMRMEWMINFLNCQHLRHKIKELWWIPIDDQSALHIDESAVIHKRD
ncbi:MAG: hypothetical protein K6F10_00980 [Paludibacteraceae bacterium]|nr:hypothetical protein [Paludibacteraceae bacterium]